MAIQAFLIRGKPIYQDYDPGSVAVAAGQVVVIGDLACVASVAIPAFTGAVTKDALAIHGGIYQMTADAAYPNGTYVYWDPTNNVVTAASGGNCVPFGWLVGGADPAELSDGGPASSAYSCAVFHDPTDDSGLVYNLHPTSVTDNVTNTSTATAFATTTTIPAGTLLAGDTIHIRAAVQISSQASGTDTQQVILQIQTAVNNSFTVIYNTGLVNVANNGLALIDADIVLSAAGASGAFIATGDQAFGNTGAIGRSAFLVTNTAINTNQGIVVQVTGKANAASTSNVLTLVELLVEKRRK